MSINRKVAFIICVGALTAVAVSFALIVRKKLDTATDKKVTAENIDDIIENHRKEVEEDRAHSDEWVYFTEGGSVYHKTPDCPYLAGKSELQHGTVDAALTAGKSKACSKCWKSNAAETVESTEPKTDSEAATN